MEGQSWVTKEGQISLLQRIGIMRCIIHTGSRRLRLRACGNSVVPSKYGPYAMCHDKHTVRAFQMPARARSTKLRKSVSPLVARIRGRCPNGSLGSGLVHMETVLSPLERLPQNGQTKLESSRSTIVLAGSKQILLGERITLRFYRQMSDFIRENVTA